VTGGFPGRGLAVAKVSACEALRWFRISVDGDGCGAEPLASGPRAAGQWQLSPGTREAVAALGTSSLSVAATPWAIDHALSTGLQLYRVLAPSFFTPELLARAMELLADLYPDGAEADRTADS
jgi:hypothetical protein